MKIGNIQFSPDENFEKNLEIAKKYIYNCVQEGAEVVVLPEMFICPFDVAYMKKVIQERGGIVENFLSKCAREFGIHLIGGSFPLRENEQIYNTSITFSPEGEIIDYYHKRHVFTVDVRGKVRSDEGSLLSTGNRSSIYKIGEFTCSTIICYDIRFFDVFEDIEKEEVELLFIPAAFNDYTGPLHWHVLARARSIDYQLVSFLSAPAASKEYRFHTYGHSLVVDAMGRVLEDLGEGEKFVVVDIKRDDILSARKKLRYRKERLEMKHALIK